MERLVPMPVAWQVSPSTPFLRLKTAEMGEPMTVNFVAHFALFDDASQDAHAGGQRIEIALQPDDTTEEPGEKVGPYQLVVVAFKRGLWARWAPSYSDTDAIDDSRYDWSAMPARYRDGEDIEAWLGRFAEEWRTTGNCPMPGFYEVEQSRWREETRSTLRHFLIEGHDAFVEVLAEDWSWRSLRVLRDW